MADSPVPTPVEFVLVPGLGLDERSSRLLRASVPATVVPLPGMGLAEAVPSLDALAARLLRTLGAGPFVLVGHSQSGQWKHPVPSPLAGSRRASGRGSAAPAGRHGWSRPPRGAGWSSCRERRT